MNLEILKERETPLLSRKRITAMIDFEGPTPSRIKLIEDIAKKLDVNKDLTIIKHIYTRYGAQKAKIIAHIYDKEDAMNRFENEYLLKKHIDKKKEETAEKPKVDVKEEPAEEKKEKPAEDKKEEKKEEKSE